ncbi:biopolymer transporter ExbB [Limibaculum sp. M0105]|uniref:Biopolymer transporter ExbB n=1 Tax=Thermohalobaculum xanthum TaxID=2753746 RepID=A0A8J7M6A4_9RHOB|nr:biopolymer transporter ExbB [Thermohalobaculum xanthum]MBK0398505.1 biopolymer transporter ExbB [Thermohalobaculum xanthum]
MAAIDHREVQFSRPVRQIFLMLSVLGLVAVAAFFLFREIQQVFFANPYLNGVIIGIFVIGVMATFWQVGQLIAAMRWVRSVQAGYKGIELTRPPSLMIAMAPLVREGGMQKRIATSSTRSILDSVSTRLDETRDITRYLANLLIFLGLLGTFWGLSKTVPAVVDTIRSLAPADGQVSDVSVFDRLMTGLESQLGGMGTAFASSLLGLAGSLVVGMLELFAGHGQNRFYRELEEWLASFTRLGLISEGEGPEGPLVALLERVDEGLEKTVEFAARAEAARIEAENRLARAADVVGQMAEQIENERSSVAQMVSEMREGRENQSGRDHAVLTVLKRIDQGQSQVASSQAGMVQILDRALESRRQVLDSETRQHLRNLDHQMRQLIDELALGRQQSVDAIRAELRLLIRLIDERTGGPGGEG